MKSGVILLGGGGHCRSVLDVMATTAWRPAGILDNNRELTDVDGTPVLGSDDALQKLAAEYRYALVTVGHMPYQSTRAVLYDKIRMLRFEAPVIISAFARVSQWSSIGEGSVIMHFSAVNAGAMIGQNCIINTGAIVEHDVHVGDNCHISTGAIVNGGVKVGDNVFIGSGAIIREGVEIGSGSVIGMGAMIRHNVPAGYTAWTFAKTDMRIARFEEASRE